MAEYISAHINLFGAWAGEWTAQDVYDRKPGTDPIRDLISLVLERKPEELTVQEIERFRELSPPELYLPVVPDEQKLVDRLLRPLKSAKRSYCFGENLATIALCGLVGETLAMLAYRIRKHEISTKVLNQDQEEQLYGKDFDGLDQWRRVKILRFFNFISAEQEQLFSDLRGVRKKYLHLWEVDSSQIQADARKCFLSVMRLFKEISGLSMDTTGALIMSPHLLQYIKTNK